MIESFKDINLLKIRKIIVLKKLIFLSFLTFFLSFFVAFSDNNQAKENQQENTPNIAEELTDKAWQEVFDKPDSAIQTALQCLKVAGQKKDSLRIAELNRIIGIANYNLSNYTGSLEYYVKSLRIYYLLNNKLFIAHLYNDIAISYLELSDYQEAKDYFFKAMTIFDKFKKKEEISVILLNISLCYQNTYDYINAISFLLDAIRITEKLNDKKNLALQLNNLAVIYKILRNYDNALMYFKKSYSFHKKLNDLYSMASNLNNMGNIYNHLGKYKEALAKYDESLKLKKKINNKNGVAVTLNNIGEVFENQGYFKQSLDFYEQSLTIKKEIDNYSGIIYSNNCIARIYFKQKDYNKSEYYFLRSVELGRIHNVPVKQAHFYLSEIYNIKNNFSKSLKHLQLYSELQDSVFSATNIQQINELLSQYHIEKKDKEISELKEFTIMQEEQIRERTYFLIALGFLMVLIVIFTILLTKNLKKSSKMKEVLKDTNRIQWETNVKLEDAFDEVRHEVSVRRQAEAELVNTKNQLADSLEKEKELNELKTRFISMVSHEYRNPLTFILNSTELLRIYNKQNDLEKHEKQLKDIRINVDVMVRLLNDVLIVGRKGSKVYELKPLKMQLIELCKDVITNSKVVDGNKHNFNLKVGQGVDFINTDPYHLSHILSNLITNATKYSPVDSDINIEILDKKDSVVIKISDQGIGIPEEDKKLLFQPFFRSTNIGSISGTGLGLTIVSMYVEMLKGKLEFESEENKGTTFILTLPKEFS